MYTYIEHKIYVNTSSLFKEDYIHTEHDYIDLNTDTYGKCIFKGHCSRYLRISMHLGIICCTKSRFPSYFYQYFACEVLFSKSVFIVSQIQS